MLFIHNTQDKTHMFFCVFLVWHGHMNPLLQEDVQTHLPELLLLSPLGDVAPSLCPTVTINCCWAAVISTLTRGVVLVWLSSLSNCGVVGRSLSSWMGGGETYSIRYQNQEITWHNRIIWNFWTKQEGCIWIYRPWKWINSTKLKAFSDFWLIDSRKEKNGEHVLYNLYFSPDILGWCKNGDWQVMQLAG
jgi:hypothetical protein